MVERKEKAQRSPCQLCPERLPRRLTAGCKRSPGHPDLPGTGATPPPPRSPRPPSAQDPLPRGAPTPRPVASARSPLRGTAAFPPRGDSARAGEGAATPRLLAVRREPAPCTPQPPGPRRPLLSPGTPAFPPPGACPRRRQSRQSSRPPSPPPLPPQSPGRVPERGLRLRVACVVRRAGACTMAAGGRRQRLEVLRAQVSGAACQARASPCSRPTMSSISPPPPHFSYGPRKGENNFRQSSV